MRIDLGSLAALSVLAAPLFAQAQASPYSLGLSQAVAHDSNIYRLSDGSLLPPGASGGDTVTTTTLQAGLDQPIGRQRLHGDVQLRASRFAHNRSLNFEGYGANAGLDWATVYRLSGSLSLAANRSLARFNNDSTVASDLQRNIEDSKQADASVRIGVVTRWSAEANVSHQRLDYSAPAYAAREFRQNSLSAGLRYRPSAASNWGLALRHTQGQFPRFAVAADGSAVANHYQSDNIDLTGQWLPSGASEWNARLSLGQSRFDRDTARDFSGLTGALSWLWRPTGKLRLETRLARDSGQDSAAVDFVGSGRSAGSSRSSIALRLSGSYEVSAKITLNASAGQAWRDLADTRTLLPGLPLSLTGRDRTGSWSLGARWAPTRWALTGCEAGREQRSHSGLLSTDFSSTTYGCFGQINLR